MCVVLRHFKQIIEFIFAALYAFFLNLSNRKARHVVIYYHGINNADVTGFSKQMDYLAKNCSVVKPSQIKTAHKNGADILVAITFDDAFLSVMKNAVPVLKKYGLPAGISVPVGNLGQPPRWQMPQNCPAKNETVMGKEQIAKLDNCGFEIFSHTFSHPVLTEIEDDGLEAELVNSKRALERIVGHEVLAISYPHGACDARVYKTARKAGYRLGFTIEPALINNLTDDLKIWRTSISPGDNLIKFKLKVSGAYQLVRYIKAAKRLIARFFIDKKVGSIMSDVTSKS